MMPGWCPLSALNHLELTATGDAEPFGCGNNDFFGSGSFVMGALAFKHMLRSATVSPMRVLVLDDDAFDRKRMRRWIERSAGTSVRLHEAFDLVSFSAEIALHTFDLVILDYGLTDGTGLDAVRTLRNQQQNSKSYAVIVSGREDDELRDKCLSQGSDHFVGKGALDLVEVGAFLDVARFKRHQREFPDRAPGQTAVSYWKDLATERAQSKEPEESRDNISVLRDLLGVDVTPVVPSVNAVASRRDLNADLSSSLRLFISDFLDCDEFEFEPNVIAGEDKFS